MSRWDEIGEEVRIINISRGIDMREAVGIRLKKRVHYIDLAQAIGISTADIIDYEHERKPMPEDKYESYMKTLEKAREGCLESYREFTGSGEAV